MMLFSESELEGWFVVRTVCRKHQYGTRKELDEMFEVMDLYSGAVVVVAGGLSLGKLQENEKIRFAPEQWRPCRQE